MKKNQLRVGVVLTYVNLFASNIIALVLTPFILRNLGQSEYGVYSLVWTIVNYLTIMDMGFSDAIIRYAAQYREKRDEENESRLYGTFLIFYIIVACISIVICLVVRTNFSMFAKGLSAQECNIAMKLILIGSINIAVTFPFNVFRGIVNVREEFVFVKAVDCFRTLVTCGLIVWVLLREGNSFDLMCVYTLISIVVMFVYVYYSFFVVKQRIVLKLCDRGILKEIFVYSFFIFLGMIVDKIYWGTDQIIMSIRKNSNAIAIYTIGSTFPSYFILFSTAISGVLLPRLSKLQASELLQEKEKKKQLSEWFLKIARLQFWVLSLVFFGFVFWGRQFIYLWAGEAYRESYAIALIIMLPSVISLSQTTGIAIVQAMNKIRFRSISYIFIAVLNIFISLALVDRFGGIGCAIGTSIGTIIGPIFIMNIYYYKVIGLDIPMYWKNICSMTKSLVIPIFAGWVVMQICFEYSWFTLIWEILVFCIVFFISAYLFGFDEYEKELIKELLVWFRRHGCDS